MKHFTRKRSKAKREVQCFRHFAKRVRERLGGHINALDLWNLIQTEMQRAPTEYLTPIVRLNRSGRRLWRVNGSDTMFALIYDHEFGWPVTVMREGEIKPQGKTPITIERELARDTSR